MTVRLLDKNFATSDFGVTIENIEEIAMEISGIRSAFPFMFPGNEKDAEIRHEIGDTVDVHAPQLLADDEVEDVLNDTIAMIGNDSASALSVHSGLTESRVFALLGA